MKRLTIIALLIALFMAGSIISFAQEPEEIKTPVVSKEVKESKEGKMEKCHKYGMMKKMASREMVATKDGGVIVLVGNKLLKFDKDLNLKKEVIIDTGWKDMKKKMMEKRKSCMHEEISEEE